MEPSRAAGEVGTEEAHFLPLRNLYFYPRNIEGPSKVNVGSNMIIFAIKKKNEIPLYLPQQMG